MKRQKSYTMKQLIKRDNALRFICYSEFTSILCKPLYQENYTIGINCSNDDEETALLQFAASHIGNPSTINGLVMSGFTSKEEIYDLVKTCKDVTVHINRAYLMSNDLKKDIWRLSTDGDNSNIMVACGANDLLKYRNSDFLKARSIVIDIPTLADIDIDKISESCCQNYGHIIEPFINQYFLNKDQLEDWFNETRKKLYGSVPKNAPSFNIIHRQSAYFALTEVAGILLENVFKDIGIEHSNPTEVVNEIWKDFIANDWAVRIN